MEDFMGAQNNDPYQAPVLYQGQVAAPSGQAVATPAQYSMQPPEFVTPEVVQGEAQVPGSPLQPAQQTAGAQATPAGGAAVDDPGLAPLQPPTSTQPGQGTSTAVTPPAPVPTPPNPASPTVPGMPNQATPGWQGAKPEFLPTPPANMPGPTQWNVEDMQTVQGQLRNLLNANNPAAALFERMRSDVVRSFQARGGKNSLRAWQAAEMTVVETAFKIAASDAQVYARSAEFNAATKNQFSAAEQSFMHQAMLSDQSYRQAKDIQAAQIAAEEARARANAAGGAAYASAQGDLMDREQDQWIERAAISHRYNTQIIGMQDANERGRMRLNASLEGGLDTTRTDNLIRRDNNAGQIQTARDNLLIGQERYMADFNYRTTWSLNEQTQGHRLETLDRTTDNQIRERNVAFGHQMTINYQSEVMQNLRQNNSLMTQILSTPGLTPAQQQAAMRTIGQMTATTDELIGSFYTSQRAQPGNTYSDYLSYGNRYTAGAAPTPGAGGGVIGGSYTYPAAPATPPAPTGG